MKDPRHLIGCNKRPGQIPGGMTAKGRAVSSLPIAMQSRRQRDRWSIQRMKEAAQTALGRPPNFPSTSAPTATQETPLNEH